MNDRLELGELAAGIRRRWWLPALLAAAGVVLAMTTATSVPPLHRSQATVLVGPTNGAVTHSSTIRTSENLAVFYADMARRQIVLQPVVDRLGLTASWSDLRDRVSAVVPDANPRLVTVTVMGSHEAETDAVANGIVKELVALSPAIPGSNNQLFINEQAESLKATIKDTQARIDELKDQAESATDPEVAPDLRAEVAATEDRVGEWQRVYVELIAAEPTSDAGGLQVLDEATAVTDMGRSGATRQAVVGGGVGGSVGLLLAWLLHRRAARRRGERRGAAHAVDRADAWDGAATASANGLHGGREPVMPSKGGTSR